MLAYLPWMFTHPASRPAPCRAQRFVATLRSVPELLGLHIADPAEHWAALGFAIGASEMLLGGVRVSFGGEGAGLTAWSVSGLDPGRPLDGLQGEVPPAGPAPAAVEHPNGAVGIDHVVVLTPDFDRTAAALDEVGMRFRRIRTVGEGDTGFRQGFRRLGPAILEVVESHQIPAGGPARFWGLVVIVTDLDALARRLGELVSAPKPAVQPGRRIATLRAAAGLRAAVAFMDLD
jgi:hypothetical protein